MRNLVFTVIFALAVPACTSKKETVVVGTIQMAVELQSKIAPSAALYIIARPIGAQGGPPLAAQRVAQPFRFPIEFKLTQADAMAPDQPFQGEVTVTVRVSQSGSASPASAGDIEGVSTPSIVEVGSGKKLAIELIQVRK